MWFAIIAAVLVTGWVAPKATEAAAWVIALGFLLPFFTVAGGTLLWVGLTAGGHDPSYASCLAWGGLPLGLGVTWFVLAD